MLLPENSKDPKLLLLDATSAESLKQRLENATFEVVAVEVKPYTERPKAPFTTSTMQQEANRKLGMTAKMRCERDQRKAV